MGSRRQERSVERQRPEDGGDELDEAGAKRGHLGSSRGDVRADCAVERSRAGRRDRLFRNSARVRCAAGLVARRVGAYGLPNALRISIGTEEANRGVVSVLGEFVKGGA